LLAFWRANQQARTWNRAAVPDKSVYSWSNIVMSIAGGLAAAAVFAVLSKGTMAGFLLAHLAPLPIMIVALGLGVGHGATAAIVGTVLLTFWPHWLFGMAYGLLVALPAWLACFAVVGAPFGRQDRLTKNLPAWAVTALCLSISAGIVLFLGITAFSHGTIEEPLSYVQGQFYAALEAMMREHKLGDEVKTEDLTRFTQVLLPATFASYAVLLHALNLWVAGRLTQISGMLKLPWPDIAAQFSLARPLAAVFLLCVGLSMLQGFGGAAALAIASPLGLAFGFQGLAVTHYWLRGTKASLLVLTVIYFLLGLFGAPMILFTLLGLCDVIFRFRERKAAAGPSPYEPR
jgi:hypothetical protein